MAEYAHLSEIDPELAPLLAAVPKAPTDIPIEQIRAGFVGVYKELEKKYEPFLPPRHEYTVTDHDIDVGDGVTVRARSVVPTPRDGEDGTFPLLFWIHGGGFVMGNLHLDDYRLRIASHKLRIATVNCEYRCVKAKFMFVAKILISFKIIDSLAPEHPFPAAVDDTFTGLKFVASHPEKFSASLQKGFIVGGSSAGGNLAAVLAHLARDDAFFKDKPVTGQLLHIPPVIHYDAVPEKYKSSLLSLEQNKDAPTLGKEHLITMMSLYKPPPTDTRISPLLLESHKGLPAAYLQVCGLDPLRDEGLLYEKVLKEAGVPTKLDVYPGVPHGFEGYFFDIKQAAKLREDFHVGLQWLLEQKA
ncbi:hypothetical protein V5O48_005544 [Marasmius crinis-equi]|uniref:Alpha/beta hydrolase fold-3 domain-containing protein n=1 Tax=Marasmius crinis-equi TaxID=585013 RepID=A0ABR3FM26_9AGAR